MPEPMYGISRAQHRTDMPARWIRATDGLDAQRIFLTMAILASLLVGAALVGYALRSPVAPMPTPASREAVLERQVGALSTHVADLENRNRETLESLAGFPPEPTPEPAFHVPADCCRAAVTPPEYLPVPTEAVWTGRGGTAR